MAMATDAPKDGFRLSMLIYDTRFRSITIQVVVLVLFALFVAWLLNNTVQNLEAKGRHFDYGFLWVRSGYDIEQHLIPYTNDSTHFRALLVGLVNTLVVAILGCILATIVGVVAGVLRLSKNWLIARIMTVYVEIFRNIPLLLWLLIIFVPMSELSPPPAAYRVTDQMIAEGKKPEAEMILFHSVAITASGIAAPKPLFACTMPDAPDRPSCPSGLSVSGGVVFGILAVLFVASLAVWRVMVRRARAVQEETGVRPTTWWKSLLIVFAPVLIAGWLLGFHLEIPKLTRFDFVGGIQIAHSFTALLVGLTLYTGAFIAEIVRAGILAISRGQSEAAFALGLRPGRTMNLIILPQALRVIIPPLISQYLNLTKNSSLGIAVSYLDLRGTLGGITLNQTGRELECMLLMMLIYLTISLTISSVLNFYNRTVQLKSR